MPSKRPLIERILILAVATVIGIAMSIMSIPSAAFGDLHMAKSIHLPPVVERCVDVRVSNA